MDVLSAVTRLDRRFLTGGVLVVGIGIGLTCGFLIARRVEGTDGNSIEELGYHADEFATHEEAASGTVFCDGIWTDVSGAVGLPGVYCLPAESIVRDALTAAGSLSGNACSGWIARNLNASAAVEPNSKLYVPSVSDAECGGVPSADTVAVSSSRCSDGKLKLNTASAEELDTLPGIGPATAAKIIERRPFSSLEDLLDVSGLGESTFEKIEALVCL